MHNLKRHLLLAATLMLPTLGLSAQNKAQSRSIAHETELAVTYSAQMGNSIAGNQFWMPTGAGAELSMQFFRGFSGVVNVTGSHVDNINGSGVGLTLFTTTGGVRYTAQTDDQALAIWGEALFGDSHGSNSLFPTSTGTTSSANSFATKVGGGWDLRLDKHLAVRPVEMFWVRTQFPNGGTNVQNNYQIGAGLIWRIRR